MFIRNLAYFRPYHSDYTGKLAVRTGFFVVVKSTVKMAV